MRAHRSRASSHARASASCSSTRPRCPAISRCRLVDVVERRVSPYEAFGLGTVLAWTLGALVRGRFDVLRPFFQAGQVGAQVAKQLKQAKQACVALLAPSG